MVLNERVIRAALFHRFSGQLLLGTKLNVPSVIFTKLNTTSTVFAVTNSFMEVIMSIMVSMFCVKCFPDKIKSFCKTPAKKGKENIFYSSIRFLFETIFIPEQIAENRFGALLEISDKFITKFNVFSYMIDFAVQA